MVYEQDHTTETTPDSNAIDCSDRLTPGESRYRTSSVLELHMSGFGVYQGLPRIFSVLRVDSTSPRSTYG